MLIFPCSVEPGWAVFALILVNYLLAAMCGFLGLGIVLLTVPLILKICSRGNLFRRPGELHHTHLTSIPRLGGLALVAAFFGVELFITAFNLESQRSIPAMPAILIGSLAMFGLGFWDDLKPLGAKRKLLWQIVIALAVCFFGVQIERFKIPFTGHIINLAGWGVFATVLWLVAMANLINLIDGVDGLAGGICLMLMVLIAYVGNQSGYFELLAVGMVGALLGFLRFNFPPARIYLGDGGAYFLGFQIGLFTIVNSHKGTVIAALIAPLFVLGLPIVDMVLAILRRGLRGLPLFRPDRRHLHHHMLGMGHSRRRVVLWFYGVTLVFLVMGFAAFWSRGGLVPVLLGLAMLLLLLCAGKFRFSRHWFAVGRVVGNSLRMRESVNYALSLTRWFALEGSRHGSVEELWSDLIFVAQRLGFTSVKLTLADGPRVWELAGGCQPVRTARQECQGGLLGTLELAAPICAGDPANPAFPRQCDQPCELRSCPCVADPVVFEIFCDLLAEGWIKAAGTWAKGAPAPLTFHAKLPPSRQRHRGSSSSPPEPASGAVSEAANRP